VLRLSVRRPTSRLVTAPKSEVDTPAQDEPAPPTQKAAEAAPAPPPAAPAVVEAPPAPAPPAPPAAKVLPPRLDLAYKVFMGTQGFLIGDATYRFEHDADTYRISTVAQARGLAALIVHGRGKVESRGRITQGGLQPLSFEVERGRPDRREIALFDWDRKVVTLHDEKTEPLDALTFDPLTVLWQSYFTPPSEDHYTFSVATTRKVYHYDVTREGEERIAWPQGEVDTVRWHRKSEDSKTEAWFWLAPSLHYIPVKIRVTQTARGTLEVMLDAIRTDAPPPAETDTAEPPLPSTVERVNPFAEHGQ
jgi:outer membrane lipoprotein-sorting protein